MSTQDQGIAINADAVAAWLKSNPDFFVGRDDLLERLKVPHTDADRGAVSLIERQLMIARTRFTRVDERLQGLLNTARDTEIQYRRLREMILTLLESENTDALIHSLQDQLAEQFDIPALAIWRSVDLHERLDPPLFALSQDHAELFRHLLRGSHSRCTMLTDSQWQQLLPSYSLHELDVNNAIENTQQAGTTDTRKVKTSHTDTLGSAAITRLSIGHLSGFLVLAAPSSARFSATLDTLFVDYLGEVIGRLLHIHRQ